MAKIMPESPSIELENDKRTSFGLGEHSADQETQGDESVQKLDSSTADPTKTGRY